MTQSKSQPLLSNSLPDSGVSSRTNMSGISVIYDWNAQKRGDSSGMFSLADVVDAYGARMSEELEYENVRTQPVKRVEDMPAGFVPIYLSCDWHERPRTLNSSVVEFSGQHLYKLADALCFALSEWGKCYVWGHRVSRPVAVPRETANVDFIRVKPFALNGPHAEEYLRRLDKLGEDLGRAIGEYLANRGEGLRR